MRTGSLLTRWLALAFGAAAALSVAGTALAAQAKPKRQARHHVLSGEITAYDEQAHTLTLKTHAGSTTFTVASAKVYLAAKSVGTEEIAKHLGSTASVSYTTKSGQHTASSVRITPPKAAAAKG